MSDLRLPSSLNSALRQFSTQLHRLTGAKLRIRKQTIVTDSLSLDLGEVVYIRFMNMGQNSLIIDSQIVLAPGEAYVEGDTSGPGFDHSYSVQFLPFDKDARFEKNNSDVPVDQVNVFANDRLVIRSFHRQY